MSRPRITLTGADEKTDVAELAKLKAEIGILFSASRAGNEPRYPNLGWIRETAEKLQHASLHICGQAARVMLRDGRLPTRGFGRIQVNGDLTCEEVEHLCGMYPWHEIITQHHTESRHLLQVVATNHSVLLDSSGGRGVRPGSGWESVVTAKRVGFAGGIGPDNIRQVMPVIALVMADGWWMDMEHNLRTDNWFDISKARTVMEKYEAFKARL